MVGDDKVEKKEDKYMIKAIGKDMADLIKVVEKKFFDEYGFKPNIIDTTNLIAKRVLDAELF